MPGPRSVIRIWLIALVLVGVTACIDSSNASPRPTPTPTATPVATATQQAVRIPVVEGVVPVPPDANRVDAMQRLKLHTTTAIPQVVNANPVSYDVGRVDRFWVADLDTHRHFEVDATLRLVTPHAYWYVDRTIDIAQDAIERSAQEFERQIYPTVTRYFGAELSPGIDNDLHLTVLNTHFRGAAGYYSSADEYPQLVHPFSNEREMIYIDVASLKPGTRPYANVLAHELQHAAHWRADSGEESWVNEGISVVAEDIAGFTVGLAQLFTGNPDVQLTDWAEEPRQNGPHYAAAYLFFKYLGQHYGGLTALKDLVDDRAQSIEGVSHFLQVRGYTERFIDVFRDWVVANFVDELGISDFRYRYPDLALRIQPTRTLTRADAFTANVHQMAAQYLEVRPASGSAHLTFRAPNTVKLIPNDPNSGRHQWWSNKGDSINSTLTRAVDLSAVNRATLKFWSWYEMERNWDYAYVSISTDGGLTWTPMAATHTTADNPVGNAVGVGFTGKSGGGPTPRWTEETVDLTPFAGNKVLVRFEYITDEAVNLNGFAVDDISVPEIGFSDDAETDNGWDARGFVRTDNRVQQYYILQLIEFGKDITVRQIPMSNQNEATIDITGFGGDLSRAVLVVAALAPVTTQQASYDLSMTLGP